VPLPPGAEAPAFELPSSDGGAPRSLDDLTAAGAALLAFFKAGCPTCQLAFPVYAEIERRYGDAVPVVAVSQDTLAKTVPWLEDKGFAGVALDDASDGYDVSDAYAVTSVPSLVLVDAGIVVATSEAWDRDRANAWARQLGERTGRDVSPVSREGDGLPAFKPG
jgi:peroxiredoxin